MDFNDGLILTKRSRDTGEAGIARMTVSLAQLDCLLQSDDLAPIWRAVELIDLKSGCDIYATRS
jgi:hypothetical protein